MNVTKRDGRLVEFDKNKIKIAILKAMNQGSGVQKPKIAEDIANEIEEELNEFGERTYMVEDINSNNGLVSVTDHEIAIVYKAQEM